MKTDNQLILSNDDFQILSALVQDADSTTAEFLEEELSRANIVAPEALPADAVSMHSTVNFVDIASGKETVLILVFPNEANIEEHKVSILSPVGSALIGLRVGQTIKWPLPGGKEKELKVVSVKHPSK